VFKTGTKLKQVEMQIIIILKMDYMEHNNNKTNFYLLPLQLVICMELKD